MEEDEDSFIFEEDGLPPKDESMSIFDESGQSLDIEEDEIDKTKDTKKVEKKTEIVSKPIVVKEKEARKDSPSANSDVKIVNEVRENYNKDSGNRHLKDKIANMKGDDVIEIMLLLEQVIFRFDVAHGKNKDDINERYEYTRRLTDATDTLKTYILDMKRIADTSGDTIKNLESIMDNLIQEITRITQEVDLSPIQKGIVDEINQIISKMPINEINQGVGNFIQIAGNVKTALDLWKGDAREFEERSHTQRKKMREDLENVVDAAKEIQKINKEQSGKRFGIGSIFTGIVLGIIIGVGFSSYLYQDYFGSKFDAIIKNISAKSGQDELIKDSNGKRYIIYDKRKMKMIKSGEEFRLYFD